MPVEPFLVDDRPERKHRGRISRVCLGPIWEWVCRDLMPDEAKTYVDQVSLLLSANEKNGAEQVARAFQDLAEQRMREALGAARTDDKLRRRLAGQVGTPHAIEDVREIAAIFKVRDALAVIASQLPPTISNLADEPFEEVSALLGSPVGRHRDVFLYALLVVMGRLGSPWQLIRLGIHAAKSDVAARIAETPFAVAVDVVLTDIERMISKLRSSLKAGLSGESQACSRKFTIRHARCTPKWTCRRTRPGRGNSPLRALQSRSCWRPKSKTCRARSAACCVRAMGKSSVSASRSMPAMSPRSRRSSCSLPPAEVTRPSLRSAKRRAHHLRFADLFRQRDAILLDRLRTSPPGERSYRQSQVDAAVRFCARLFGADYAGLLAKAADLAAKGEQKAVKA